MNEVGVGTRVINFLVDYILIFAISYGLYKWYIFYVRYWSYKFIAFYVFFHFTVFAYYTLFELATKRTPGKLVTLTRVINAGGGKPAFHQILVRSLVRLTLISPFFIPMLGRPLHDYLSKTKVVEI
ncbi:MAG TPA: RDD family protein [Segetibacter sp.]|jgi:uncharacterized RDD family membrane protein YckC